MKDIAVDLLQVGEIGLYGDVKLQAFEKTKDNCFDCYFIHESCTLVKCDASEIHFKKVD